MERGRRIAYYGLPMLFCLAVHWMALRTWFFADDFAWLGLPQELEWNSIWHVLFAPAAQGTVRTLSERLYFLVFTWLFGIDALPLRIWAFLTQFASIALLIQIARRLTRSEVAGFLAPILWVANSAIAGAIGWSSAYNEIAVSFLFLVAFRLLLLYVDTGELKYWIWQWVAFILGFGALELNVVYPALAAGYALSSERRLFPKTLWLFVPSVAYTIVHFTLIPPSTDPAYQMYFDEALVGTFWRYWAFAWGALRPSPIDWRPEWLGMAVALAVTAGLLSFVVIKLRKGNWTGLFLLGWFLAVLLPLLPLKSHFTEYYLTVPIIGGSILGAWAIAEARGWKLAVAIAVAALYFTVTIDDGYVTEAYWYERAKKMKYLVTGLAKIPKADTRKMILITGVDNALFWSGFGDDPFRLIGISAIYLAPGTEENIDPHPEWGGISRYVISLEAAYRALETGQAIAYELVGSGLRDVTPVYLPIVAAEYTSKHPDVVDVGSPLSAEHLGPTWYPPEEGFRWMPKSATVKIAAPRHTGQALEVAGYCPAMLVAQGPLEVSFRADGVAIGRIVLKQPNERFKARLDMPASLVGTGTLELEITVNRTTHIGQDKRDLGLIFETFTMK